MKTTFRIFRDSTGRELWYIKAANGKITDISEEFLKNDPKAVVAFEISPSLKEDKKSQDESSEDFGKTTPNKLLQFLTDVGGAALILAIPLYVSGWTYLQSYYKGFGLRMTELGFSLYDTLVYSIPVLIYAWWTISITLILLLIMGVVLKDDQLSDFKKTMIFTALYIFLVIGATKLGARMGNEDAVRDVKEDTTVLPYVGLDVDPEKVKNDEHARYDSYEYVLLLNKNGLIYVFAPLKQMDDQDLKIENKSFVVTVIPSNLINSLRIQRAVQLDQ